MRGPSNTRYLNPDFDLSLRPRPQSLRLPRITRQVHELSAQGLIGADPGDRVLLRVEVPAEFVDHLGHCGLPVPELLRHPRIDPASRLCPFGWTEEAIALNRRHDRPAPHPPLSCIRRVNSRSFAHALETERTGEPPGRLVENAEELDALLRTDDATNEWVVKAEHGNSGLANRRLRGPRLTAVDRRFVEQCLGEDDRLVVEPWRERERDWCVVFDVPFSARTLRVHEQFCTRDGALIGSLFDPAGIDSEPWAETLTGSATAMATQLEQAGYFGPVCADAFSWRGGGSSRLRVGVDLNCRRSMSDGAYRLWRRAAPDRALYYRFFSRRKIAFPEDLSAALAALGDRRYDRSARRGVLLASPPQLEVNGERRRPGKLAVIFVADDRSGVLTLDRWFRERFEE